MSKDDTLMNKLEALMSKNRGAPAAGENQYDDIPILTDILNDGAHKPVYASPTLPVVDEPFPTELHFSALSDERIRAIAREVQAHVMRNIEPQLSGPIQEKLLTKIDTYVNEAVRTALSELKQEISDSITTAVTDALSAEAATSVTPAPKLPQ
ncbi:MAG: hypothetical protein RL020_1585 [Pseudomonadota bacterium]|jgi:hypothetical protein